MVLDLYQDLLRNHLVITLFLTMLVGAGGNAGNQSAIKVIRGLVGSFCRILSNNTQGCVNVWISSVCCGWKGEAL